MLNDNEEAELVRELRRMRSMLQLCNETVHSRTDAEIKTNYVDWKSWCKGSPYHGESISSMRRNSYARKSGAGQAAINVGLKHIEKMLLIIKNKEADNND